jgi:hypothetical protein
MSRIITANKIQPGPAIGFALRGVGSSLSVRRASTDQVVTSGSDVVVQFNNVAYDSLSEWDAANHKWVCGEAGVYMFTSACSIGPITGTEFAQLSLMVNGSVARRGSYTTAGGTSRNCNVVLAVGPVRFSAGDDANVAVIHNGAGTVNVRLGSANSYFNVHRVL